jgi:branched-chain amino acid transport system permease protein
MSTAQGLARRARWRWPEIVFWLVAFGALLMPSGKYLILNEIAILALFALSLDLILGYAGIVSLGHAAFFGVGAYTAGLVATIVGFLASFLVLRGSDLTRLMVTLGVALVLGEIANAFPRITGGADGLQGVVMGKLLGHFEFDLFGRTAYAYSLATLFVLMLLARRIVHSPFGLSLMSIRGNPLRAAALGVPVHSRLIAAYTLAAAYAGAAGALLAQTTAFVSLDVFEFHRSADLLLVLIIGGAGWLYGGIAGALIYKMLQDGIATLTPQYWQFWIGLFLVIFVMVGRQRLMGGLYGLLALARRR